MSEQTPYERLGVSESASFEEIQNARQRLSRQLAGDSRELELVEAAYDSIIMERLRLRQEGKIKVPERIRFPERTVEPPPASPLETPSNSPAWLQDLLDAPSRTDVLLSSSSFLLLGGLTLTVPDANAQALTLLLPLGFVVGAYLLWRKERRFGRSLAIALVALLVGVAVGTLLAPVVANGMEPAHFESLVAFFFLWLFSSFLR